MKSEWRMENGGWALGGNARAAGNDTLSNALTMIARDPGREGWAGCVRITGARAGKQQENRQRMWGIVERRKE